ncbi:hypothetical protein BVY03_02375 [bacterium K02(2017)]|nr:hypothetical protein BVY03_02375 [bacterium K02(2017)]
MSDFTIYHHVGIKADVKAVYQALTTDRGLASWWTKETKGAGPVGAKITFTFNTVNMIFEVVELNENNLIKWQCVDGGGEEWPGTTISFALKQDELQTHLSFKHAGWRNDEGMLSHCSTKWAVFLLSLKKYLESGKGNPFPDDVQINYS